MKISGSIQRMCMGGWLLAALLIGGFNIHPLVMMENQPLVGYSQTIKTLQASLRQFDQTLADGLFSLASQVKIPEPDTPSDQPGKAAKGIPVSDSTGPQPSETTNLPSLTGIVHVVRAANGTVYFQALLNGRFCRTKDEIDGFTVEKISPDGVVVRRAGIKWTIESPTPYYSSDQGN